jgi:hypothetical protein
MPLINTASPARAATAQPVVPTHALSPAELALHRDPVVYRKLEEFYQSVVMPPPLGLYKDVEAFGRYRCAVESRIVSIMTAYDGETRALHLDLVERYGASPFFGDDQVEAWSSPEAMRQGGALASSESSFNPERSSKPTSPSDFVSLLTSRHSSSRHDFTSPAQLSFAEATTDELLPHLEPLSGFAYATASGKARHPQQVRAVRAIWESMQTPPAPPQHTAMPDKVRDAEDR